MNKADVINASPLIFLSRGNLQVIFSRKERKGERKERKICKNLFFAPFAGKLCALCGKTLRPLRE